MTLFPSSFPWISPTSLFLGHVTSPSPNWAVRFGYPQKHYWCIGLPEQTEEYLCYLIVAREEKKSHFNLNWGFHPFREIKNIIYLILRFFFNVLQVEIWTRINSDSGHAAYNIFLVFHTFKSHPHPSACSIYKVGVMVAAGCCHLLRWSREVERSRNTVVSCEYRVITQTSMCEKCWKPGSISPFPGTDSHRNRNTAPQMFWSSF